jgi:hypothetical protein
VLTLFRCDECGRLRQNYFGNRSEITFFPTLRCDYCKSMDTRNDLRLFFEPFERIVETGCTAPTDESWVPEWARDAVDHPPASGV